MLDIINKTIGQVRSQYGLAGGILVAVKDGKCVVKYCFGEADVKTKRPIDEKTLFQVVSCSKAFTTMIAGQLCDEGKLTWETPVKELMPDFAMVDKYAEARVTPRDMACHRTGLSRHDAMRKYVREDRADLVRRIAYFPPVYSFRERYSYQNQMYVALGHLCERLTGQTWEELLTERIGKPLGMEMYFRGHCDIHQLNAAMPYSQRNGVVHAVPEVVGQASNPCGGLYVSADSLEKWLYALCGRGEYNGKRIISEKGFAELIKPNVVVPGRASHPAELQREYALAWTTAVYKGHPIAYHSGSTNGFNSMVGFFPEENMAYALSVNTAQTPAYSCLGYVLRDILLDDVQMDYSFLIERYNRTVNLGPDYKEDEMGDLPLTAEEAKSFCGCYENPGYGMLEFVYENEHLRLKYGLTDQEFNRVGPRKFVGFDAVDTRTFRAEFTENGDLTMRFAVDAVCPIDFERVR